VTEGASNETWNGLLLWAQKRAGELVEGDDEHLDSEYELLRLLDSIHHRQGEAKDSKQLSFDFGPPAIGVDGSTTHAIAAIQLRARQSVEPAA
jgi:hypothetical protein